MPEVHSSLRLVNTRVRGLSTATASDEPIPKSQFDAAPSGGLQSISAGEGISIDDTDPLNPVISAPSSSAPTFARNTVVVAEGMNSMATGKASILSKLSATSPARIRVYGTAAARAADASRGTGTFPAAGSGCLLEFITTAELLTAPLSPAVSASNFDTPPAGNLYCNIEPIGSTECDVTFTYLTLEA